ncbi:MULTISPECIES: flagellar export protein FliJ [Halanaerobium]|jgi:flagellar export protein FliJ|uniref:Flagellar FliJ protein/centromere protein F n=1 Tax=Halanaerobium kushneri TaxID=56779 RepID=A0A1N6UD65_9FIRM|nr:MULTISPECIES: flagellar export protein FliJ [Halanaerobium]RCW53363.1 flagellar FliJ protein [Halanaerobium sp. ST460_2HS_T2]SIQ63513.1 flagellar FliJ protein/centromere protein F [Halanaerobium kushneri]
MKGYKFKFEKILNLRIRQEEQEEDKYLILKKELNALKNKIKTLESEKENIFKHLRDQENDLALNISLRRYLKNLKLKQERVRKEKKEKKKEVDEQLDILLEKKKERKTLEKLKEQEIEKFVKEFLEDEQKELDELGRLYSMGGR